MAFLNPPPFKKGEWGDLCGCLAPKGDAEKLRGYFQKAMVLPVFIILKICVHLRPDHWAFFISGRQ
jgi:hypothetical protein